MSHDKQNVAMKIEKAFFSLLKNKSFHQISISEITKEAGVSRMSFYRNFDTKIDIASEFIKNEFYLFKEKITQSNITNSLDIIHELFKLVEQNQQIRIMLREENIFIFHRSFLGYMTNMLQTISDPILKEENRYLVIVYRSNGLLGYLSSWCQAGCRPSTKEAFELFEKYCCYI